MRARPLLIAALLVVAGVLLAAAWLFGVFQPDVPTAPDGGPALALVPVASGFDRPVQVIQGPDGMVVVEQGGRVRAMDGTVLLDVGPTGRGSEQGLLSAVWHDGWFTHHTDPDGDTVLSRWEGGQQTVLWTHPQPYNNHNGGMLAMGPDGMLWLALGDGGLAGDPDNNAQDAGTHLGGLLRFDVSDPQRVHVPADNPFPDGAPYLAMMGLRNPWRFSFDLATGELWIGDVGQGNVEEINRVASDALGANFGWPTWEGENRFRPGKVDGHVRPVAQYDHDGGHCSVTGGYVVRDGSHLDGTYVLGDFCSGQLWTYHDRLHRSLDTDLNISSFGQDAMGRVYVVDHGGGIYRIQAS